MAARAVLPLLLLGLLGSRWDGQPIVVETLESAVYFTGDTSLLREVVNRVIPADLLEGTMTHGSSEPKLIGWPTFFVLSGLANTSFRLRPR